MLNEKGKKNEEGGKGEIPPLEESAQEERIRDSALCSARRTAGLSKGTRGARVPGWELFRRQAAVTKPQDFQRSFMSRREAERVLQSAKGQARLLSEWGPEPTVRYHAVSQTQSVHASALAESSSALGPSCSGDRKYRAGRKEEVRAPGGQAPRAACGSACQVTCLPCISCRLSGWVQGQNQMTGS